MRKNKQHIVYIENVHIGNNLPLVLIAGPDSLESWQRTFHIVSRIKTICQEFNIPYIMKASYDKANRSSWGSFRGVGFKKGLKMLSQLKKRLGVPVTTDVHSAEEAFAAGKIVDLIQIPALLSRQTDIIVAAAGTGKAVNVKKGQFMSPIDVTGIISKVKHTGNSKLLLTERGYMFGYQNLVADMRSLEIMKMTGYPVIFDASHSIQLPSAKGKISGGQSQFIFPVAKAAAAVGVAGVFLEVYDDRARARVDKDNALLLKDLPKVLEKLQAIDRLVKE